MRALLLAIVTLSCPVAAAAQSRAAAPTLPPIGLPLAPIGLPLAPIGLSAPTVTPVEAHGSVPSHDRGRRDDHRADRHPRSSPVYVVSGYYDWPFPGYGAPAYDTVVSSADAAPAPPTDTLGRLRLEIDAAGPVQVFVDGYFAGTLAELNGELEIEPGPHRVEFRAAGYEPAAVDVRLAASKTISYRTSLTPSAAPPTPEAAAPRSTIYFIPGCYLGNVHPSEVALPSGCDLAQLVIRKP